MLLLYFGSKSVWALSLLGLILVLAAIIAIQAHRGRVRGGNEELPGMTGEVTQASDARGRARALVRGEIWQVYADTPLKLGQSVRVRAEHGLMLKVEPVPERDVSLGEPS